MRLNNRNLKKVFFVVAMLFVLVGCTANLDKNGALIPERVIDSTTKWSLSQGWFDFLMVMPFAKLILFFEPKIGIVASIVVVTIIVNLITLPLMIKSTVMSQKMQLIQPQVERIQMKYRGRTDQASQMRMSQEMNNLYKKNNIKMGQTMMLPFLSMPIMIGIWQAVQRIPSVYSGVIFGINLGEHPWSMIKTGNWQYLVLIILLGLLQWASVEISNILMKKLPNYKKPKNNQMKFMNIYMVALIVFMSLSMPSAMSLYWIITSFINVIRSVYIHYQYTAKMHVKMHR